MALGFDPDAGLFISGTRKIITNTAQEIVRPSENEASLIQIQADPEVNKGILYIARTAEDASREGLCEKLAPGDFTKRDVRDALFIHGNTINDVAIVHIYRRG